MNTIITAAALDLVAILILCGMYVTRHRLPYQRALGVSERAGRPHPLYLPGARKPGRASLFLPFDKGK
ncbi:hypothetical protein [Rothia nasimurium]|uniref:hypothetical protein n=1 Tax=Rothia nasimurium TaxID=85336 RepID=UPI001F28F2A2|nr:hypothetical protein [Rothia nasimurium]